MQTVADIMTPVVNTVHRDTVICEVEGVFVTHKISGAPLVDDLDNLVGFVSKSDITRFDAMGEDSLYTRVYEIASPRVIVVAPTISIEDAAQKMVGEQVHHLVVIEEEAIVGMLSAFDFVKLVAGNSAAD